MTKKELLKKLAKFDDDTEIEFDFDHGDQAYSDDEDCEECTSIRVTLIAQNGKKKIELMSDEFDYESFNY